jgi:MOSC domain
MELFNCIIRPRILPEQSKFFSSFLNSPTAKLVYLGPEPRTMCINEPPPQAQNGQLITTAFADCAPYLLVTEESFNDVNHRLINKLEIIRFRPNIVVKGTTIPWDEDSWKEITIGNVGIFYIIARCPRCQLPKYFFLLILIILILLVLILKLELKIYINLIKHYLLFEELILVQSIFHVLECFVLVINWVCKV